MLRLARAFSTSHLALLQALAGEQKAYQLQPLQPLLNYPASRGFTLTQKPESSLITLSKSMDGYDVTVSFASQPAQKQMKRRRNRITREGKGLLFECQSTAAQMEIRNIAVLPYSPEEEDYAGPVFVHLENKLKRASLDFLRAFGVSDGTEAYV